MLKPFVKHRKIFFRGGIRRERIINAIASLKVRQAAGKIAIIDFDCHHGNGTEDIFLGKKDFLYLSLHQSPLYPGTGLTSRENCINYPLPANTSPEKYLSVLDEGLKHV